MKHKKNTSQSVFSPETLKMVQMVLSLGIRAIDADEGALLIYNAATHDLTFTEITGTAPKNILGQKVKLGEGVTGNACLLQETQIGSRNNADEMKNVKGDGSPFSVLAVPLFIKDQLWGCMTAVRFTEGAIFRSQDGDIYNQFAVILTTLVSQQQEIDVLKNKRTMDPDFSGDLESQDLEQYLSSFAARNSFRTRSVLQLLKSIDELKG